jgi:ribosome biogenesis GTPase
VTQTFPARVVSVGKNAAHVVLDAEDVARIADLKRSSGKREMPVPGDRVAVRVLEDGRVLIDVIEPRTFVLQRRTIAGRAKTMAANVDTMVTVTSLADPPPRLLTLDQLLAFAELESIDALVVFTKPDLAQSAVVESLAEIYRALGYGTEIVNPKRGDRMEELRARLSDRKSLLCGVSGVGKSSIFRRLGGESVIGETSRHGLGRQTTTAARLYRMSGGFLIDSPGVAEFGLGRIEAPELAGAFREMGRLAGGCRFSDCSHLHEPECAVREAVAAGSIAQTRYASYRQILGASPEGAP